MTHLIVAIDRKGAIGRGGDQLYYIKEDLRHFKALTMGNTIIMEIGRASCRERV